MNIKFWFIIEVNHSQKDKEKHSNVCQNKITEYNDPIDLNGTEQFYQLQNVERPHAHIV